MSKTTKRYCAFLVDQRKNGAPKFCIFSAPASEVLQWARIAPLNPTNKAGVQRVAVKSRVKGIERYFKEEKTNIIPTAVVVAFSPNRVKVRTSKSGKVSGPCSGLAEIEFNWDPGETDRKRNRLPAYVIDGQHRLKGIEEFDSAMHLPVVGILEADDNEIAFQFLVINNKQYKVPKDHVRALAFLRKVNKRSLETRLHSARLSLHENYESVGFADNDKNGPFYKQVRWPTNPKDRGFVVPASIELSISHIHQRGIKDQEQAQSFFLAIWSTVKSEWGEIWNKNSKLLNKVSVICLTEFITDTLVAIAGYPSVDLDLSDDDDVKKMVCEILGQLDPDFFTATWASTSYDTGAGRRLIRDAIDIIYNNARKGVSWYEDVEVLEKDWLNQYMARDENKRRHR